MNPPIIFSTQIKPEWIDYNNHMNVAYYVSIFDLAGEALVKQLGMGKTYTDKTGISWVVLENHITYDEEVSLGDEMEITVQLIDHDHKRLHLYFEMYQAKGAHCRASTLEQMVMCVDLNRRRSATFPQAIMDQIEVLAVSQSDLPRPDNLGRLIGIKRKQAH